MIKDLLETIHFDIETATPNEAMQVLRLLTDADKLSKEDVALLNLIGKTPQPAGSFPSKAMIVKLENLNLVTNFRTETESSLYGLTHRGWTICGLFKQYEESLAQLSRTLVNPVLLTMLPS